MAPVFSDIAPLESMYIPAKAQRNPAIRKLQNLIFASFFIRNSYGKRINLQRFGYHICMKCKVYPIDNEVANEPDPAPIHDAAHPAMNSRG